MNGHINILNEELYNSLKEQEIIINPRSSWYELTYPVFIAELNPLKSIDDIYQGIAFVYSWMPRIPNIHKEYLNDEILELLQAFQKGQIDDHRLLCEKVVPIVNNSIVGTSKLLHFINPKMAPIIDSKVINNWNSHVAKNDETLFLPAVYSQTKKIDIYLKYWKFLDEWIANTDSALSYREIEKVLFRLK